MLIDVSALYHAARGGVGFIDRSDRGRLEVAGPDRAKFLHNLTTNDVKRLAEGRGCEAFVTSPQGKTLGYVTLLAGGDRIVVRADPGGLNAVLPHLEKYGVFDEVTIDDVAAATFELHLSGTRADEVVRRAGGELPEGGDLRHRLTRLADRPVRIVREAPTGRSGLTVLGTAEDAADVSATLHQSGEELGVVDLTPTVFEILRIEAGTPVFGRDLNEANLPQEVGRDALAINFVKGCYLGQETVARIDALGHVNKVLKGLRFGAAVGSPAAGAAIEADGKAVGTITSAAFSPGWGTTVALAYVRRTHALAGTEVQVVLPEGNRPASVTDLPMPPPALA